MALWGSGLNRLKEKLTVGMLTFPIDHATQFISMNQ